MYRLFRMLHMLVTSVDSFISFSIWMSLFLLLLFWLKPLRPWWTDVVRTNILFFPHFWGKLFFQSFTIKRDAWYEVFIDIRLLKFHFVLVCSLCSSWAELKAVWVFLSWKKVEFCQMILLCLWDALRGLLSITLAYYFGWLLYIIPDMYIWNKSCLIMVHNHFILDVVC